MKNEEEEEERTCLYCGGVVASLALPILTTKVYINIQKLRHRHEQETASTSTIFSYLSPDNGGKMILELIIIYQTYYYFLFKMLC